jgi:hypothetical protein
MRYNGKSSLAAVASQNAGHLIVHIAVQQSDGVLKYDLQQEVRTI